MNMGRLTDPFDKPPPPRSVADAVNAERPHDAAHKITAGSPGTPPARAGYKPIRPGELTDPSPPRREPANSYSIDVGRLSEPSGSTGRNIPPSSSVTPMLGDGMDRYVPRPPGFLKDEASGGKVLEVVRKISDHPGAEPLWAAWRLGLKDLQAFVLQPFPDSTAPREEPGSIGTPAPSSWTGQQHGVEMDR